MAVPKTYPVPTWVRTIICLVPFVFAGFVAFEYLSTGRGFVVASFALALCAAVIKNVLTKQ